MLAWQIFRYESDYYSRQKFRPNDGSSVGLQFHRSLTEKERDIAKRLQKDIDNHAVKIQNNDWNNKTSTSGVLAGYYNSVLERSAMRRTKVLRHTDLEEIILNQKPNALYDHFLSPRKGYSNSPKLFLWVNTVSEPLTNTTHTGPVE